MRFMELRSGKMVGNEIQRGSVWNARSWPLPCWLQGTTGGFEIRGMAQIHNFEKCLAVV